MFSDRNKYVLAMFLVGGFIIYTFQLYNSLPVKQIAVSQAADDGKILWQKKTVLVAIKFMGWVGIWVQI
jgi:hypothetical protein